MVADINHYEPVLPVVRDISEFGDGEGRTLQDYLAQINPLVEKYGVGGWKWHKWEHFPVEQWNELDAQVARTEEWKKLKGPATKLTTDEQLGEEGPYVTQDSTYGIYTGSGVFNIETSNGNYDVKAYGEDGMLHVVLFTNLTEKPRKITGSSFYAGGTSVVEYNSGQTPNVHAIAGLPLLDSVNHHCGIDCGQVIVQWVVLQNNDETGEEEIVYGAYQYGKSANGVIAFTELDSIEE
jgi:hypothetical protein